MSLVVRDRIMETSTSTGTGDFTLAGAVTGYSTFGSAVGSEDEFDYVIFACDDDGVPTGDWERGRGALQGGALVRNQDGNVLTSGGNAVVGTFDFPAGPKRVMLSVNAPALQEVYNTIFPSITGGGGAGARPTIVQYEMVIGSSDSITLGSPTTPGNLLVAVCLVAAASVSVSSGYDHLYLSANGATGQLYIVAKEASDNSDTFTPLALTDPTDVVIGMFEIADWDPDIGLIAAKATENDYSAMSTIVADPVANDLSLTLFSIMTVANIDGPLSSGADNFLDSRSGSPTFGGAFITLGYSDSNEGNTPSMFVEYEADYESYLATITIPGLPGGGEPTIGKVPLLPPGGTTGQVLVKLSDDDYDVAWQTPA